MCELFFFGVHISIDLHLFRQQFELHSCFVKYLLASCCAVIVFACNNADDALKVLREGYHPDAILFDITMPDSRSGYEFIETVQKERLAKHALKIALTNEGSEGAISRAEELGADAHLLKAKYVPSELATTVTELLSKKR